MVALLIIAALLVGANVVAALLIGREINGLKAERMQLGQRKHLAERRLTEAQEIHQDAKGQRDLLMRTKSRIRKQIEKAEKEIEILEQEVVMEREIAESQSPDRPPVDLGEEPESERAAEKEIKSRRR